MGLTQGDLAVKLGANQASVSNWEAGRRPRAKTLARLQAVLGLDGPGAGSADFAPDTDLQLVDELPPAVRRLGQVAQAIFIELPRDGSRLSNARLRSLPALRGVDDDEYPRAKESLVKAGVVVQGAGRTGTLARAEAIDSPEDGESAMAPLASSTIGVVGGVALEDELYEPFRSWLEATLSGFAFQRVADTSSGRNRVRSSGKWSRPDVTAVTVSNYELLPGADVEVASYEIKRAVDLAKILESIYEAAAHGRWAHRASLVQEVVEGRTVPEDIVAEAGRFGLGVYTMTRRDDGRWEVEELREPDHRLPEPQNLSDLIEYFLSLFSKSVRAEYVRALR